LSSIDKFNRGILSAEKAVRLSFTESTKKGFNEASNIIRKFADESGIGLAEAGAKAGRSFGSSLSDAISTTARFGIAQMLVGLPAMFVGAAVAAGPLIAAISQIAAGLVALGSQAFYAAGALAALPAAFSAVAQATTVLGFAFSGVEEALGALQTEQGKTGGASNAMAQAVEAAARRVENAKRSLARAQEAVARSITDAEESLARTQESASERVSAAQEKLARAHEAVAERIADAQDKLASVIERANERISAAESRLASVRDAAARKVEEAQSRISEAVEDGARRVGDAERDVARTLRDVTEAQEELNRARAEAAERLEDLANEVISGQLGERGAEIALEEAQARLNEINGDPKSTDLQKRKARLAYDEAVQRLREIKERNEDLRQEQEKANREGVEGSEEVTDAKQGILDAIEKQRDAELKLQDARREAAEGVIEAERALQDAREEASRDVTEAERSVAEARAEAARDIAEAEKDLTDARKDGARQILDAEKGLADARKDGARQVADAEKALADARLDGARQIEDAQRALKEAMEDATRAAEKTGGAVSASETALKKLSPAAREFVMFLNDEFLPKIREIQFSIQEAFFPPIQEALSKSGNLLDLFKVKLTDTATIFGDFAADVIDWLNTDESRNRLGQIMDSNNRIFRTLSEAAKTAGDAILTLAVTSGPFLEAMARLVKDIADKFHDLITEAEQNGKLEEFWMRVETVITRLVGIAWNLGTAFGSIMDTAYPAGERLLKIIEDNVKEFTDWVTSTEGKNQLREWFDKGVDVFNELLELVKDIGKWFLELGTKYDFAQLIKTFREELLPPIKDLVNYLAGDNGEGLNSLLSIMGDALKIVEPIARLCGNAFNVFFPRGFTQTVEDVGIAFQILGGAMQILSGDIQGGKETIEKAFREMYESSDETLRNDLGGTLSDTGGKVTGFYNGMRFEAATFGKDNKTAWVSLKNETTGEVKQMQIETSGKYSDLRKDIGEHLKKIEDTSDNRWDGIRDGAKEGASKAKDAAVNAFQAMKEGISSKFTDTSSWVRNTGAPGISNAAGSKEGDMKTIGHNYGIGFWNGLSGVWNGLIDWWNRNVDGLVEIAKRILGINSPSKVMMEVGKGVGEGMALGIQNSQKLVNNATADMAAGVVKSWGKVSLGVDANLPTNTGIGSIPRSSSGQMSFSTQPVRQRSERNYNITMIAAPTIPTDRQMLNAISYADSLYN
jgi:hypothetical protein